MNDQFEVANESEIEAAVKAAQEALAKDATAPREIAVTVKFHKHEEYPKSLYRGKDIVIVGDAVAEAAAVEDGFGSYDHKAFTAKEA